MQDYQSTTAYSLSCRSVARSCSKYGLYQSFWSVRGDAFRCGRWRRADSLRATGRLGFECEFIIADLNVVTLGEFRLWMDSLPAHMDPVG
jgi:hypothetical protein